MAAEEHDVMMVDWMAKVVYTTVRGVIACFPHARLEKVLILLSAVMGQQLATVYAGDELSVFKLRRMCKDAFCEAMTKGKLAAPPPPARETASIGRTQ